MKRNASFPMVNAVIVMISGQLQVTVILSHLISSLHLVSIKKRLKKKKKLLLQQIPPTFNMSEVEAKLPRVSELKILIFKICLLILNL